MKTVTINCNSWHCWLARVWERLAGHRGVAEDFCQYVRWVVGGFLVVTIGGAAACVLVGAVVWTTSDFLGWLVAGIIHGFVASRVTALFLFALVVIATYFGGRALHSTVLRVAKHQPAFLRDAYTSLKDRVCYRVEVR